jgi:hypothetical protein
MPLYPLSFTEPFFSGEYETGEHIPPSDKPTSVLQAIVSLPLEVKKEIAIHVIGVDSRWADRHINAYYFYYDLLDRVRETDLCDGYESPVTVYIDPDQNYSLTIYE